MPRKALLIVVSVLLVTGVIFATIRIVAAMQGGNANTDMTKSVARITYLGQTTCSGSVVGDDWVLTALHCLYPNGNTVGAPLNWRMFQVQLWQAGVDQSPGYESFLSEPPILMPGGVVYSSGTEVNYRDVILLHVATHMPDWAETIPTAPAWPSIGTALTEYGYGRTSKTGTVPNALEESQSGAISRINCPSVDTWTSGHLCIHSSISISWGGDSGGPLVWKNNGYWQEVGSLIGIPPNVPEDTVRYFWSEADGDTRNWILSTVGATAPFGAILRDEATGTSWWYKWDGYRYWIPDGGTYNCLVNNGATVLNRPLRTIEALPEMVGSRASCAPSPSPTPTTAPSQPTPTPTSQPSPLASPTPIPTATPAPQPQPVEPYNNYGTYTNSYPMCRGNPGNSLSMPGGTVSQTFTVPGGVASLNSAMVQIDPDSTVTAHLSIAVNGAIVAAADAAAAGDTHFSFGTVSVSPGDVVTLSISFTATYGKIITVYTAGDPGGTFTTSDSCPDGASNVSLTSTGLRAVVYGMS